MIRRRLRVHVEGGEPAPEWLTSMLDVFSLLTAFFVMILAYADFDPEKFGQVTSSLSGAFSTEGKQENVAANAAEQSEKILEYLKTSIDTYADQNKVSQQVYTEMSDEGLTIINNDPYLFIPGQAELGPRSKYFIRQISRLLKKFPFIVKVEGHTDNVPMKSSRFNSNWDLSVARAAGIINSLEKTGIPGKRFVALGYGPHRPIATNKSEKGRALNRRIVILIEHNEVYEKVRAMLEKKMKERYEKLDKKRKKKKKKKSEEKKKAPKTA